jgi:peptidoglycan hydrolase-like protein with peptidoglycan-binding domain
MVALLSAGCTANLRSTKTDETSQLRNQVASLEGQVTALNQKIEELSQGQTQQPARVAAAPVQRTALSPKKIQVALRSAGYYEGPVDGKIGPQTREAVKAFQKANGLNPDGVVGSKTSAALARVLDNGTTSEQ